MSDIIHEDLFDDFTPLALDDEISRDADVKGIIKGFGGNLQKLMVIGSVQSGKTNLLEQFCRYNKGRVISYFIEDNPFSQSQYSFLYSLCYKLSVLLQEITPGVDVDIATLNSLFTSLVTKLSSKVHKEGRPCYFVIDGIDKSLNGIEGERIIDKFPLPTRAGGIYLLYSCRTDKVNNLPYNIRTPTREVTLFNSHETQTYLASTSLSQQEISNIHNHYNGTPGYLKIVKEIKINNPDQDLNSLKELDDLINQHLDIILASINNITMIALETLAISPVPLNSEVLVKLVNIDANLLINNLLSTGIIDFDEKLSTLKYKNGLFREIHKSRIKSLVETRIKDLIEVVLKSPKGDDALLSLLYNEIQDYEGLQTQLTIPSILSTVKNTGDISSIVLRLRLASRMASNRNDIEGLLKWTLGIIAAKSFINHVIDQHEIWALLAIDDSRSALRKIYAVPELTSKVRLLSRAYISMREKGDHISNEAKEELRALAQSLPLSNLDKDIAKEIIIDLMPILPDMATKILEEVIKSEDQDSIVDIAINEDLKASSLPKTPYGSYQFTPEGLAFLFPSWIQNKTINKVLEELKPETTKSKEYIIRIWCRQNKNHPDIVNAINLWLDTVENDRDFIIVLRSLRHISEVLPEIPLEERKSLIERLKIPKFTSINAPKEELIRLRLNLAEAMFDIDPYLAQQEVSIIHTDIISLIIEPDEQAFCLSRLKLALYKIAPSRKDVLNIVNSQFHDAFNQMLINSAEHFTALRNTINTLVITDPEEALIISSELNTRYRRIIAFHTVLRTTLIKHGENDVSRIIKDAIDLISDIDVLQRDISLINITEELKDRSIKICQENCQVLLIEAKNMYTVGIKAQALTNIAFLYSDISIKISNDIITGALEEWRREDDLNLRLETGYQIVETIAKIDMTIARDFYTEVQSLILQPSASLVTGELGSTFIRIIEITIRSLSSKVFLESPDIVRGIEQLINRIPSKSIRMELYAKLASSAYRVEQSAFGNEITRNKIIQTLNSGDLLPKDRNSIIVTCLPVIYRYDNMEANKITHDIPPLAKNMAWFNVVRHSISNGLIGDTTDHIGSTSILNERPQIQKSIIALSHISYDYLFHASIKIISSSIEASYPRMIDITQALDALHQLDDIIENSKILPDQGNIKHKGYIIYCLSQVHKARSSLFKKMPNKRGLNKKDIDDKWNNLCIQARSIPNAADRILVMANIAQDMSEHFIKDRSPVRQLLEEAYNQIPKVSTLIDSLDRVQAIADAWQHIGDKDQSKSAIQFILDALQEMQSVDADARLAAMVQLAYKVSPDFADTVVSRFDSRLPLPFASQSNILLQVEKLIGSPTKINEICNSDVNEDAILQISSKKMLGDFTSGKGTIMQMPVLENWLQRSQFQSPNTSLDIVNWVVESLFQKRQLSSSLINTSSILEVADFIYTLSRWISPEAREGVPVSIETSFSGLQQKVITFDDGEEERARRWLEQWLSSNVTEYIKICDPYFGFEEISYLKYIPLECKVLIISTDKRLDTSFGIDSIKASIKNIWQKISSQLLPNIYIIIIPSRFEGSFHDRAIITKNGGLDIGQSLNGIGSKKGKITILTKDEAESIEKAYVDPMMNQTTWFMQQGITPTHLQINGQD